MNKKKAWVVNGILFGLVFMPWTAFSQCLSLSTGDLYTTNLTKNQFKIGVRDETYTRYNWRWRKVGTSQWETFTNTVPYYIIDVLPTQRYEFQCKAGCRDGSEGDWSPKHEFINDCEKFSGSLSYLSLEDGVVVYLNASGRYDGYEHYGVKIKDDYIFGNRNWGSGEPDFEIPLNTSVVNEIKFEFTCPNGQKTGYTDWYAIRAFCNPPQVRDLAAIPLSSSILQVICQRPSTQFEFRIRELGESTWRSSGRQIIGIYQFENVHTDLSHEIQCRIACGDWSESMVYEGSCHAPELSELNVELPAYDKIKITDQGADDGVTGWQWRWRVLGSSGNWLGASTVVNNYTMRNLLPSTDYEIRLRRICGQAEGEWLENIYISTDDFPCIPPIDGLDVGDIKFKSATLFTYVDEFDRIQFRYRPKQGQHDWIEIAETRQTRQRIDQLEYGTRYEFQGRLKCNGEYSEWVAGPDFTTLDCIEPNPNYLLVEETTANSFTVTFIGNYDYDIDWRYRETGSATWIKPDRNGQNEIFVYGLPGGVSYDIQCRLVCGIVNGKNVWSEWVSAPSVVTQDCYPEIRQVKEITSTSMKVIMPEGFDGYALRYKVTGTNAWVYTAYETNRRIVIDNLLPGTQYEIECSFLCSGVYSAYSEAVLASTLAASAAFRQSGPDESQLSAEILDAERVRLNVHLGGFNGYQFRVRPADEEAWRELVASMEDNTIVPVSWQEECTRCNEYFFQARVLHAGNLHGLNTRSDEWSSWSAEVPFSPLRILNRLCPPLEPRKLVAAQIDQHSAVLVVDFFELDRYRWRLKPSEDSTWTEPEVTDRPYLNLDSLTAGTLYEFQVAIPCQGGFGGWSASQYFQTRGTEPCAPPEYQNLYATRIETHSAIIGYPLKEIGPISWRYRPTGQSSWTYLPTGNATIRRLSGLEPGTPYEYQARIFCADSLISLWSPYGSFVTKRTCHEISGDKIVITRLDDRTVRVSAHEPDGVSYAFRYRATGTSEWTRLPLSSSAEVVINDLEKDKNYEIQVYTQCQWSAGQWSESQPFTLQTTTAVKIHEKNNIRVYPNPSEGQIYIDLTGRSGTWDVQVINVLGQVIKSDPFTGGSLQSMQLQVLPNLYFLRLRQHGLEIIQKIVIR